jgi:RNA polymerase sigma factor (sigma-70 family)
MQGSENELAYRPLAGTRERLYQQLVAAGPDKIKCFHCPEFEQMGDAILSIQITDDSFRATRAAYSSLAAEFGRCDSRILTPAAERLLLVGSSYARFLVRQQLQNQQHDAERVVALYEKHLHYRNTLIHHNMRLSIVVMMRRHLRPDLWPTAISHAHESMLRAAESIDPNRNIRYSTYAVHAINNGINNVLDTPIKRQRLDAMMADGYDVNYHPDRADIIPEDVNLPMVVAAINSDVLDPREREALTAHYLQPAHTVKTYAEIGEGFKVSRERVRQIAEQGIKKLRNHLLKV